MNGRTLGARLAAIEDVIAAAQRVRYALEAEQRAWALWDGGRPLAALDALGLADGEQAAALAALHELTRPTAPEDEGR